MVPVDAGIQPLSHVLPCNPSVTWEGVSRYPSELPCILCQCGGSDHPRRQRPRSSSHMSARISPGSETGAPPGIMAPSIRMLVEVEFRFSDDASITLSSELFG